MKKIAHIILFVLLFSMGIGCSRAPEQEDSIHMQEFSENIYVSRMENSTVYGVEMPDSTESLVLDLPQSEPDDTESSSSESSQAGSSSVSDVQSSELQTTVSQPNSEIKEPTEKDELTPSSQQAQMKSVQGEMRGIWLSYLNMQSMIQGKSKAEFVCNLETVFQNCSQFGFNTVFVQVRPFGDALYASDYFPWSAYLTGEEGIDPGYDPLAVMCGLADAYGLRIEAWINPYRVRTSDKPMSNDNQAKIWLDAGDDAALSWNNAVYYNPGSEKARALIVNGVAEIVRNYNVDGIHFDDYFYPTTDFSFDKATWKASGSEKSQADWRRENVNILIRQVYSAIKAIDSNCVFGISPQGNVSVNYEQQFADVKKWLSSSGYVDYICPQIYYGYENDTCPYAETVSQWDSMITGMGIDLYVGIAAYKLGAVDEWAGDGKNEWLNTDDLLSQMVKTARKATHYQGVALYSYDSLFSITGSQIKSECQGLKQLFS